MKSLKDKYKFTPTL